MTLILLKMIIISQVRVKFPANSQREFWRVSIQNTQEEFFNKKNPLEKTGMKLFSFGIFEQFAQIF